MLGAFNSPLGPATVAGYGTVDSAAVPPKKPILAPWLDQDGQTKIGADGELEPMPVNAQRVLNTCMTVLGSSTVLREFGVKLPQHIGDRFQEESDTAVRAALQYMVDDGSITIQSIVADRGEVTGRVSITVSFEDNQTGVSRQVRANG